jgi:SP family arabinose:H+ symporter-like MFS transporter
LQQITDINAVYFYARSIFKQTSIGTDAAFSIGVLLSTISVVFTFIVIYLISRIGRRLLLLIGTAGIFVSLLLCAYSFNEATYQLSTEKTNQFDFFESQKLLPFADKRYKNDVTFKNDIKVVRGNNVCNKNNGAILEAANTIKVNLVLIDILGFRVCFAFLLGSVMWVLLLELYPIRYSGLAIGAIGFVNSFVSWFVQQFFLRNYLI